MVSGGDLITTSSTRSKRRNSPRGSRCWKESEPLKLWAGYQRISTAASMSEGKSTVADHKIQWDVLLIQGGLLPQCRLLVSLQDRAKSARSRRELHGSIHSDHIHYEPAADTHAPHRIQIGTDAAGGCKTNRPTAVPPSRQQKIIHATVRGSREANHFAPESLFQPSIECSRFSRASPPIP